MYIGLVGNSLVPGLTSHPGVFTASDKETLLRKLVENKRTWDNAQNTTYHVYIGELTTELVPPPLIFTEVAVKL